MGALLFSGLAAIAAANVAWLWFRCRHQAADIRLLRAQRDHARRWCDYWCGRTRRAENALQEAADKATSLQERNRMLSDLMEGSDHT